MHIEEFSSYKIFLYDDVAHDPTIDEAIMIPYSRGTVYFSFYHEGKHENHTRGEEGSYQHFVYIPTSKYPRFVDLLRYEKPLYIAVDEKSNSAYLTTEMEPVGEGNVDMS